MVQAKNMDRSNNMNLNSQYPKEDIHFKWEINIFIAYFYIFIAIVLCLLLPNEYLGTSVFYIIVILSAIMFAALSQNCKTSFFFNIFLGLSFLVLFFVLGFRNYSGIDDPTYISIFNSVSEYGWWTIFKQTTMEPGYLILNDIVSFFTNNYLYMQLLSSFIPLFLFYYSFKRFRNMISIPMAVFLLCTMLYFQVLSVAIVRMFIAISIVFTAFYYIPQRKIMRYILLILIASMFHYSALFMLVLTYFAINRDNLSKRAKRFVYIGFIVTPLFFVAVAKFFVPLMGNRYAGYGTIDGFSLSVSSFDTIPLLVLLLLFYKRFKGEDKYYFKLFISVFALSCIMSFYSGMVSLGRLIFYANSAFFLAAPMVSRALNRDSKKLIFSSIIILFGFIYVYWTQFTLEAHISNLFPYQNILFTK
jgi:hypothetical protein